MNMKRCTLALILALYSACAAQETEPSAARDEFLAQVKQWREDDLMSDSPSGVVTTEEWQTLQDTYP